MGIGLRRVVALVALIAVGSLTTLAAQKASTPPSSLRIVVIEGEDAVNIIQQKTAVAPIVEVRDRNDQPVAGATVRFAIRGGRATFSGARTLTVTTNAAGRAAVTGLTPTSSGALQISAAATFQGQTAAVTIAQTNVLTAAQAASAAGASSAGGTGGGASATGGAAGAGGGISGTTIGLVVGGAAAVAGGAILAKEALGGGISVYEGAFRIDTLATVRHFRPNGTLDLTCTTLLSQRGEVRAEIEEQEGGTLVGHMSAKWSVTETANTCPFQNSSSDVSYGQAPVTGSASAFQASSQFRGADGIGFGAQSFAGTLSSGVIRGTWTLGPGGYTLAAGAGDASSPAVSVAVTLTK